MNEYKNVQRIKNGGVVVDTPEEGVRSGPGEAAEDPDILHLQHCRQAGELRRCSLRATASASALCQVHRCDTVLLFIPILHLQD